MVHRSYFETEKTAWEFANNLPKGIVELTDYGKDESKPDAPYFIEYKLKKEV